MDFLSELAIGKEICPDINEHYIDRKFFGFYGIFHSDLQSGRFIRIINRPYGLKSIY
jgi:hypothetical protein